MLLQKPSSSVTFLWSSANGLKSSPCTGFKLNDVGQVLGANNVCDLNTGKYFILKPLPNDTRLIPNEINNRGEVVGSSYVYDAANNTIPSVRAVFYNSTDSPSDMDLAYNPNDLNQTDSVAWAINNNGQVPVVGIKKGTENYNEPHIFIFDSNSSTLLDLGVDKWIAWDINDNGKILLHTGYCTGQCPIFEIMDSTNGKVNSIYDTFDFGTRAFYYAHAINNQDKVIGSVSVYSSTGERTEQIFWIWDKRNGIRDLNELISKFSGYKLESIIDINDQGQILATASRPGYSGTVLLNPAGPPPIPTSFGQASSASPTGSAAEPVNTATGNYYYQHTDLKLPGRSLPFAFTRTYNDQDSYSGPLGRGWTHSYNARLTQQDDGSAVIKQGDGHEEFYDPNGDGSYSSRYPGLYSRLVKNADNSFTLTAKDQTRQTFDAGGRLATLADSNGNTLSFAYDGARNLTAITDTVGRTVSLSYDADNHLVQLTDPIGRTVRYAYDAEGHLISDTDPLGRSRRTPTTPITMSRRLPTDAVTR